MTLLTNYCAHTLLYTLNMYITLDLNLRILLRFNLGLNSHNFNNLALKYKMLERKHFIFNEKKTNIESQGSLIC